VTNPRSAFAVLETMQFISELPAGFRAERLSADLLVRQSCEDLPQWLEAYLVESHYTFLKACNSGIGCRGRATEEGRIKTARCGRSVG